jgi:RNA polymerase sigma-70 factor (ECF subfamily)
MLAEEKALLVSEFGRTEFVAELDAPRAAAVYPPHEAALIARLRAGELAAFEELVEEFQPLVYALAVRILNNAEDAQDAAQETFLKVYRHFAHFRGEASLKTWICRIAINQARSTERWWRRRQRSETSSLDAAEPDGQNPYAYLSSPGASPEAEALARERGRQIERALAGLKKDYRIAVILRDIEGLSYEEIAYATNISLGTVKSRIARGREMLREVLQIGG